MLREKGGIERDQKEQYKKKVNEKVCMCEEVSDIILMCRHFPKHQPPTRLL